MTLKAAAQSSKAAQKQFERDSKEARGARRKAFTQTQKKGLSLREIAELVRLDHSRVGQIIQAISLPSAERSSTL